METIEDLRIQRKARKIIAQSIPGATDSIPIRTLGKTGLEVSIIGLGGDSVLAREDKEDEALAVIERALELGINYFDTAPKYGDGLSETRLGNALKQRRKDIVLATKVNERSYLKAMRQIEQSLNRLQTDYIDILQIHHVENVGDWKEAKDNTLKAILEAKEDGIVKHVGVTGHYDPEILIRAIEEYGFDTILLTVNAADKHHLPTEEKLLPLAVKKNLGIIAMKIFGHGQLFSPAGVTDPKEALDYVWSLPIHTAIVGVDNVRQLEENVRLAKEFVKLDETTMQKLEDLTEQNHKIALFYRKGLEEFNLWW